MLTADVTESVHTLLEKLVLDGYETGIQAAAYYRGELALNAWAGIANPNTGLLVEESTLFPVFSVTKGMLSTCVHRYAERGELAYDDAVAAYWPEFGAAGKSKITIRQVLSHCSGVINMPDNVSFATLCDFEAICAAIAEMPPAWPAGSRMEYHPMTFGWILGKVLQEISGNSVADVLQKEICAPLALDSLCLSLSAEVNKEVAFLEGIDFETNLPLPYAGAPTSTTPWLGPLHEMMNLPDSHRACFPAFGGLMNAHSIARHYAALLPGGVDGVALLPDARVRVATQRQLVPGAGQMNIGLGYFLDLARIHEETPSQGFGHPGHGGSFGYADPESQFAFAFTRNLFWEKRPVNSCDFILRQLRLQLGII